MALGDKWTLGATHLVAFIAQSHYLFLGSRQLFYNTGERSELDIVWHTRQFAFPVPAMTFFLRRTTRFSVLVPTKLNSVSEIEPKSAHLGSLFIVHRTASEEYMYNKLMIKISKVILCAFAAKIDRHLVYRDKYCFPHNQNDDISYLIKTFPSKLTSYALITPLANMIVIIFSQIVPISPKSNQSRTKW